MLLRKRGEHGVHGVLGDRGVERHLAGDGRGCRRFRRGDRGGLLRERRRRRGQRRDRQDRARQQGPGRRRDGGCHVGSWSERSFVGRRAGPWRSSRDQPVEVARHRGRWRGRPVASRCADLERAYQPPCSRASRWTRRLRPAGIVPSGDLDDARSATDAESPQASGSGASRSCVQHAECRLCHARVHSLDRHGCFPRSGLVRCPA